MMKNEHWSLIGTDATRLRKIMSNLSLFVRKGHYRFFWEHLHPQEKDTVLDVGVTPDHALKDSNFFDSVYPFKKKLFIASIENCTYLVKKFRLAGFIQIKPGARLPFEDKSFDIVTSWATLEHVGARHKQQFFLKELIRIGKKLFVTTPDRWSIYEPHTATFFIHWLPPSSFRKIIRFLGKDFWSREKNLHILSYEDIVHMTENYPCIKVKKYKLFGVFPSHLLICQEK